VGFIVLREQWVDHLYVRPEWWRRGVGTRLLERAKQASPGGLRLFCFRCSRAARAVYRARGLLVERVCNADGEPDVEYRWAGDQGAVPPGSRTGHGSAGVR
jgi:GNAT superfamily N-acetyltransferase